MGSSIIGYISSVHISYPVMSIDYFMTISIIIFMIISIITNGAQTCKLAFYAKCSRICTESSLYNVLSTILYKLSHVLARADTY